MIPAHEALARLREGNRRFVENGAASGGRPGPAQQPFAIVLGCSDSRVPAEMIFGQGFGDLFVIRVAGNIVAPSQVGSVEFAAELFGTRLAVVVGHTQCGAVAATLAELRQPQGHESPNLRAIVNRIRPAIEPCSARRSHKIRRRSPRRPRGQMSTRRYTSCDMAPHCSSGGLSGTGC